MRNQNTEAVEPSYKEVKLNARYKHTAHHVGTTVYVYPVEVKGRNVKLKRALDAVDSKKMPRAEFDRYYVLA